MATDTDTVPALVVADGKIERISLELSLDGAEHIHRIIGGFFSTCFNVPGTGANRRIVGFGSDDYGDDKINWNVFLCDQTLYTGGWPVRGPIVIVGHFGPNAVAMNEREMAAFRIATDRFWLGNVGQYLGAYIPAEKLPANPIRLPVLRFVPGYDL